MLWMLWMLVMLVAVAKMLAVKAGSFIRQASLPCLPACLVCSCCSPSCFAEVDFSVNWHALFNIHLLDIFDTCKIGNCLLLYYGRVTQGATVKMIQGPYLQYFIFLLTYEWAAVLLYTRDKRSSLLVPSISYKGNEILWITLKKCLSEKMIFSFVDYHSWFSHKLCLC